MQEEAESKIYTEKKTYSFSIYFYWPPLEISLLWKGARVFK